MTEPVSLLVCSAPRPYLFYQPVEKKKFAKLRRIEEVRIATFPVFVRHGYLPHGGFGWRGSHTLRYHTYLLLTSYEVKDAVLLVHVCVTIFAVSNNVAAHLRKEGGEPDAGGTNKGNKSAKDGR